MPNDAVVDNDVLIKFACYAFLVELLDKLGRGESVGILGAARYVVADRIARDSRISDRAGAHARWLDFLPHVSELEPSAQELELATAIEEAATDLGFALDTGESQLCAIVVIREVPRLYTGDKRAIASIEALGNVIADLDRLRNRIGCLEQVVQGIINRIGRSAARPLICSEPLIDVTLSICFGCTGGPEAENSIEEALASYVGALRHSAPTFLVEDAIFP